MSDVAPSERTRVKRVNKRAVYDREMLNSILDAGVLCHVGMVVDANPVVSPTLYYRDGDRIYMHGSAAGRMFQSAGDDGIEICVAVTHLDGLIMARSGFFHSANYRSAMIFGKARLVENDDEKIVRLKGLVESLYPNRWDGLRPISPQEIKATQVIWMPIDEASMKVRTGGPADNQEDLSVPIWAGVIPVRTVFGSPEGDDLAREGGYPAQELASRLRPMA